MVATRLPFSEAELDQVLDLVRHHLGVDLRSYRRGTIQRRVQGRLQKLGCQDCEEYLGRLRVDPLESRSLVEHVTIKVSRFFRNEGVFHRLREVVLPDLLSRLGPQDGLRAWSAGCGNGEEPYSVVILLEELAGGTSSFPPPTLCATDIDEDALARAARGVFRQSALEETPADLVARYFTSQPGRHEPEYRLLPRLVGKVRFLHHDLLSGSPVPEATPFHLVLCRNVLIYLERAAQERVFDLLDLSLAPGGYICLGEAEQLPRSWHRPYETVDRRAGIYRKVQSSGMGGRQHGPS